MKANGVAQTWQSARLFPVTGIGGKAEEERRGTSVFLSVLRSVHEFGRAITSKMGAPGGRIETFIECSFPFDGRNSRPDGLIRVSGKKGKVWIALVEVKTGVATLKSTQVEEYLDVAIANGFDAVLTVSSQVSALPGQHPVAQSIDPKKLKKVGLYHLSWSEIHTEAVVEEERRRVSDPDQALLLHEFRRYIESPKSRAFDFDDMGASWVQVRNAVAGNTVKANEPGVAEVVRRFAQLISFVGMRLTQGLGVDVRPVVTSGGTKHAGLDPAGAAERLERTGKLSGALAIPHAVSPLRITADLKTMRAECSVTIDAPTEPKPITRVKWLTRQVSSAPNDLRIQAKVAHSHGDPEKHLFAKVVDEPSDVLKDPKANVRSFTLSLNRPVGRTRGTGQGSFIDSILKLVEVFYKDVVQNLQPHVPKAPQVAAPKKSASEADTAGDRTGSAMTQESPTVRQTKSLDDESLRQTPSVVDEIMAEMRDGSNPSEELPWRAEGYKPTPEAIAAFSEPPGPVAADGRDDR